MGKFDVYWDLVQKQAAEEQKVFFLHGGEGRPFETKTMEGQDLSGWLVELADEDRFAVQAQEGVIGSEWDTCIAFAVWEKDGETIKIRFCSDF